MQSGPVSSEEVCPCLMPVVNDRLLVVTAGVYCRRGDGRIRLPARVTVQTTCMTPRHLTCEGYLGSIMRAGA